jgi:hypothetical protein
MGFEIFFGILIAFGVFAAGWWSATSALRGSGVLRAAQIGALVFSLLAMATLSAENILLTQLVGGLLAAAASVALFLERWPNKVFPFIQIGFGVTLLLKIPFNG